MKTSAQQAFVANLKRIIDRRPIPPSALAAKLGYDSPDVIEKIKTGRKRLPLAKVPLLATALGLDARIVLWDWFEAYESEALDAIEAVWCAPLTVEEMSWVRELRDAFGQVSRFGSWNGDGEGER